MTNHLLYFMGTSFILLIVICASVLAGSQIYPLKEIPPGKPIDAITLAKNFIQPGEQPTIPTNDFAAVPHYVRFHIYPEEPNLHVALWASDELPITAGVTDNNSEFDVALISTVKYNLWIPERKCSQYIVPTMNLYYVQCEVNE